MSFRLIFHLCLLVLLVVFDIRPAMAVDILGVRMGPHPDKTRLVMDLSAPTAFRSFMLADPVRLVVDMPSFEWRVGAIGKPPGTRVKDIRQGPLQPGMSRVVIDLTQYALIKNAFLIPRRDGQPDRLVIDFAPATPDAFVRKRSIVFGNLEAQGIAAQPVSAAEAMPPPPAPRKPVQREGEKPLIVIDAGHGGEDPGALGGNKLKEKDITLAMARDLKKNLEATGRYRVHLTRDKDVFIRLSQRVA